jgi:hypothetical protein
MGERVEVDPGELHVAAGSLGSVSGELACGRLASGSDLGTGELEEALSVLGARLELLARAMDGAVSSTGRRLASGAERYVAVDTGSMPAGRG